MMRAAAARRYIAPALALFLLGARAARAQVGSTTDIVMGTVTGAELKPIVGARVELKSLETGITRRRTTNERGEYSILFPDGGGSYELRVTFIGYGPYSTNVTRQADEDRLVANVRLTRAPQVLAAVQVRATTNRDQPERPTAGSTERNLTPAQLDRLPIDKGDLAALAALAPGVIGVAGTDSTAASFSVAGQPTNQNQITLDGLSFGSGTVPQEAVRSTRVITSTYDVSRGQFTGGQVASTTRGGTNNVQGTLSYSLRDPELEFVDESSASFGQKYQQNSLNVGLGGPVREDVAFIFGAASVSRRTNPLSSLLAANAETLARLGASPDSVTRFLNRLDVLGVRATLPGIPDERLADNASAITRFDWSIGDAHTLTIRGDWRGSLQDGTRISPTSVPSTGGELRTMGGGAMATLTSHLNGFINEGRIYQSSDRQNTDPYLLAPDGRVTMAARLADGTTSLTNLQFGGNPSLPQESRSRLFEASDELSWVSRGGAHRVKLGLLLNADRSTVGTIPNRYGTYAYQSLADFEANRPSQFTRTISGQERLAGSNNAALYLGDAWRRDAAFQMTYGLRIEGTRFPRDPEHNPQVEALFGRRTDQSPSAVHASPRVGFTYFTGVVRENRQGRGGGAAGGRGGGRGGGGGGGPQGGFNATAWTIRGGVGEFRGRISSNLVATAVDATGLPGGQSVLSCIGSAVPLPDWTAFLTDPATIPRQCAAVPAGPVATPTFGQGQRRNVTTFADGFGAPKVWRSSLGASRRFFDRYNFNIDGQIAYGLNQTSSRDLNLDATPEFTLAVEGGRPVFSPATSFVPATGAVSIISSRVRPEYGSVSEITSRNRSLSTQATVSFGGITLRGITLNANYTFLRSRDQQSGFGSGGGFGGGGSTAGDPTVIQWGTSDQERRHALLGTVTYPVRAWLDVTAIGRMSAGQRYTPSVSGDVNGDGSRNDRAFIFDPGVTADSAVANGISRVLAKAPSRVGSCLRDQLGNIAGRNSCSAPWSPTLDLQLNFRPEALGLGRRLTLSVQLQNTLVGLDQLLHGSSNMHGWGQPIIPDRTLLFVRGFDAVAKTFRYQVNEHFGVANGRNSAFRVPFQIGLQGRFAMGQNQARQQMGRVFGGGGNQSVEAFKARLSRLVPNPFLGALALDDSLELGLTDEQKVQLEVHSDTIAPKADQLAGELAEVLAAAGNSPDPRVVAVRTQGKIAEARALGEKAIADLRAMLTPDQWAKLPASMKSLPGGRGLGGDADGEAAGRGQGGGRGGRPPVR